MAEFGAKSDRTSDFIIDTLIFTGISFFSKFSDLFLEKRILMSLLLGLIMATLAGLLRYLLKPRVDLWKAALKRKRAEKKNTIDNLT